MSMPEAADRKFLADCRLPRAAVMRLPGGRARVRAGGGVRGSGRARRRRSRWVMTPNHCSIMLSQLSCLGVKITENLGWAASQPRVAREVWDEPLSMIR